MTETDKPTLAIVPEIAQEVDAAALYEYLLDPEALGDDQIISALTAEAFSEFLSNTIDEYTDADLKVVDAILKFVRNSNCEFKEPATDESELFQQTTRVESEISSFIEACRPMTGLNMLSSAELRQITEIYNPNNLLAFSKDLVERFGFELSFDQIDMVYRYNTVLKSLSKATEANRDRELLDRQPEDGVHYDGYRTWGGYIHNYGHEEGRIDLEEFRKFSEAEDPGVRYVLINGIYTRVSGITAVVARGDDGRF